MTKTKEQITLVISYVQGMCSNHIETEIKESEMGLEQVAKRVLQQKYGYGFYYKKRKYIDLEGVKYFAQEVENTPFNFIDPVKEIDGNITIRHEWVTYSSSRDDNIIFTNDEAASIFHSDGTSLKIIRFN